MPMVFLFPFGTKTGENLFAKIANKFPWNRLNSNSYLALLCFAAF